MTARIALKRSPSSSLGFSANIERQIAILRAAWIFFTVAVFALFLIAAPAFYDQVRVPCVEPNCLPWQRLEQAPNASPSLEFYAKFGIARDAIFLAIFCAIATVLALRGKNDRMALFTASVLVAFAGGTYPDTLYALGTTSTFWRIISGTLGFIGSLGFLLFFCIFPNGRFSPSWTKWVLLAGTLICAIAYSTPLSFALNSYGTLFSICTLGLLTALAVAQRTRYRKISSPAERQQSKWVVFGFGVSFAGFFVALLVLPMIGPDVIANRTMFRLIGMTIAASFLLLIPIFIALGVMRYRLWDIDLFINRALVYGTLTAIVIGIYVLFVSLLTALAPKSGDTAVSLVVTGFLAVLFQPLRIRLQRGVNHLIYGERDDPYGVLSRLGERLGASLNQRDVLPAIAETVVQSLRVPYAAVVLMRQDSAEVAASHGALNGQPVIWPLLYQQERVGELHVSTRGPGEQFSTSDRRLLDNLARQAGAAIHSARLSSELQRSRERLVASREEERKRLRRDLHDGLGPQLASQTLTLDAARKMMPVDPAAADHLLDELRGHIQSSVTDIRRLVYDLRPPSLDELGLLGAIGETIKRYEGSGTEFHLEVRESLSPLPAAVEVAALRIAQEALTNVVKHSEASRCVVRIEVDRIERALRLEVEDDGTGLAPDRELGVGLISMRERTVELGGRCDVESLPTAGTRVRAILPLKEPV